MKTEALHMTKYNTLGHNLKRGIFNYCIKLTKGFSRPIQKFIFDMIYGLLAGRTCTLTEIARRLKEDIALSKTVDRLSRNLMSFNKTEQLRENYFDSVSKHL